MLEYLYITLKDAFMEQPKTERIDLDLLDPRIMEIIDRIFEILKSAKGVEI